MGSEQVHALRAIDLKFIKASTWRSWVHRVREIHAHESDRLSRFAQLGSIGWPGGWSVNSTTSELAYIRNKEIGLSFRLSIYCRGLPHCTTLSFPDLQRYAGRRRLVKAKQAWTVWTSPTA
jgi:hypothetical protein